MITTDLTLFWPYYEAVVARLLPPLGPGDGIPEEEVKSSEDRLGLRLPRILRQFYLKAGSREDINQTHNRLLAPSDLVEQSGALIFYEENQAVVLWGLSHETLEAEDPPVVVANNGGELVWEKEHERLSAFLLDMMLLQATLGGMQHCGVGECDGQAVYSPGKDWQRINLNPHADVLLRDGQVLYVYGKGIPVSVREVSGGGRTAKDFQALTEAFTVNWASSSLEDGIEQEEMDENE